MKADQKANLARIREYKSKMDVANPLEPLIINLIKSYINDADLSSKLRLLYQVVFLRSCSLILLLNILRLSHAGSCASLD
jgi:hypothetical protein